MPKIMKRLLGLLAGFVALGASAIAYVCHSGIVSISAKPSKQNLGQF